MDEIKMPTPCRRRPVFAIVLSCNRSHRIREHRGSKQTQLLGQERGGRVGDPIDHLTHPSFALCLWKVVVETAASDITNDVTF